MTRLWTAILRLPRRAQLVVLIGACVVLATVAGAAAGFGALITVLVGSAVVVGAVVGWRAWLARRDERRASPFAGMLAGSAAGPSRIAEPARRARLDELRKSFETGIEKFRSAGKSLYSVPWYVLVGEPGSGKTEAVRHCGVGFPPGLHEELQGAGGTLNMSWWFTNQAVILDTAGRLLFEDVEPGSTSEWQEFLKLLKRSRPNCPVNGLLLVIPADSLIRDTDQALDAKAVRLATQLDNIQKQLGVRFPAYVVITKSDLINGFREFFDRTDDPRAANQILGWSNPDTLDAPFRPELVDDHLRTVEQRLARRRMGLLIDPVHTDDSRKRRLDQVDALFAFPESMSRLAPRLRRYLERMFVAGEWSARPLFLRGIYFTSALREGAALDADLAAALKVPLDKLPEGKIWERERALFLKDLFLHKVFAEKGLVTRAADTAGLLRARAVALLGAAAATLVIVGALTWLGARGLQRSAVEPAQRWAEFARVIDEAKSPSAVPGRPPYRLPIVSKAIISDEDFKYRGDAGPDAASLQQLPLDDKHKRIGAFHSALAEVAGERIAVPTVFRPAAMIVGDAGGDLLSSRRAAAARAAFEASIVRPLVEAAMVRLAADAEQQDPWTPESTGALAQLVRVEIARRAAAPMPPLELDPLLRFALLGNDGYLNEGAADDARSLQRLLEAHAASSWPPPSIAQDYSALIADATERLALAAQGSGAGGGGTGRLAARLRAFAEAESELVSALGAEQADRDALRERLETLREIGAEAAALVPALAGRPLEQAVRQDAVSESARLRDDAARLLSLLSPPAFPADKLAIAPNLSRAADTLREAVDAPTRGPGGNDDLAARAAALSAEHLGRGVEPLFAARLRAYELAFERGEEPEDQDVAPGALARAVSGAAEQLAADSATVRAAFAVSAAAPGLTACLRELESASRRRAVSALRRYAAAAPDSEHAMLAAAREMQFEAPAPSLRSPIAPASRSTFDTAFDPRRAGPLIRDAFAAAALAGDPALPTIDAPLRERVQRAAAAASMFARQYSVAWTDGLAESLSPDDSASWADLHRALSESARAPQIRDALRRAADMQAAAAEAIPAASATDDESRRALERLGRISAASRAAAASPGLDGAFDRALTNWRALGADAAAARLTLLASLRSPAGASGQDYFVSSLADARETDLVQRWWRSCTLVALRALARDARRSAAAAASDSPVARLARFPLARYDAAAGQLTPAELVEARGTLPSVSAAASAPEADALRDAEFAAEVRALVAADPRAPGAALNTSLLAVLPERADQRFACTAEIVADPAFGGVRIRQQGAEPRIARAAAGVVPLGRVDYPGTSVVLEFLSPTDPDGPPVATAAIPGPWLGLWLIAAHDGRPIIPADRRLWEVSLPVEWPSGPRSVKVRLTFEDRELPDPSRWPR
ncbi:MAG: hypothetical protein KF869_12965 [Phycisphaeraceae bacterium]|nr:hypothetical protein [Phycisphaeraceae bacterium]